MSHEKLPWGIDDGILSSVCDADGDLVAPFLTEIEMGWTDTSTGNYRCPETDFAILKRIVCCVNACSTLKDPEKELSELVESARELVERGWWDGEVLTTKRIESLKAALLPFQNLKTEKPS